MSSIKPKKRSKKSKKKENIKSNRMEEEISIPDSSQNENEVYEINDYNDNNIDDVIKAFEYFDIGHTGKMDIAELTRVLSTFGDIMTEEEMFKIFREAGIDINSEDKIDYLKFIDFWIGNK